MPGQGQVSADISSYVSTLQTRIMHVEQKDSILYPNGGTTLTTLGDIDLGNDDILNVGDMKVSSRPVSLDQYSSYANVSVASTMTETTIVPQSSMLGAFVFAAGQPVGMTVRIKFALALTSAAGDTFTIRIKTQGATLYSNALTVAGSSTDVPVCFDGLVTVRSATAATSATTIFGTTSRAIISSGAYDPAVENTLNVTVQWGAALSTCTVSQVLATTHFHNGA